MNLSDRDNSVIRFYKAKSMTDFLVLSFIGSILKWHSFKSRNSFYYYLVTLVLSKMVKAQL